MPAQETWRPDVHPLGPGEQLEYDSSAYVMYHSLTAEWPCLSFDVVRDNLGAHRTAFPMEACLVAGTQAAGRKRDNKLLVMKLYDLHKTRHDDGASRQRARASACLSRAAAASCPARGAQTRMRRTRRRTWTRIPSWTFGSFRTWVSSTGCGCVTARMHGRAGQRSLMRVPTLRGAAVLAAAPAHCGGVVGHAGGGGGWGRAP